MTRTALIEKMESRFAAASGVAEAVLYEGYILYPYHATHGKNRGGIRFQWGVLVPPAWHEIDPSERSLMRTELIVDPGTEPEVAIRLRFLQLQHRALEVADPEAEGGYVPTSKLEVGDRLWMEWDEAIEQDFDLGIVALLPLAEAQRTVPFEFPASSETELVVEEATPETPAGRIVRSTEPISGEARVTVQWADGPGVLIKVTIEVENTTPWSGTGANREDVMRRSLIAVHTLAALEDGAFCSVFDPPEGAAEAVAGCHSIGSYAVLVGELGATDLVLASPIILYDYPALAPESEGDFHDGCEIDEILALRVLTLTDDEKAEARGTDPRSTRHHRPVRQHGRALLGQAARHHAGGSPARGRDGADRPQRPGTGALARPGDRRLVRPLVRRGHHQGSAHLQGLPGPPGAQPPRRRARHFPQRPHGHCGGHLP